MDRVLHIYMSTGNPRGFYAAIEPCADFAAVGGLEHFHRLPDDWFVVISDIRDSTPAISAGRYKDVNMIGAACIVAALNAVPDFEIPFVFGGDGATLALPQSLLPTILETLQRTRALAARELNFEMRVGAVAVAELRNRGEDVLLAKLCISPNNFLAMFAGGGVELADQLIKQDVDSTAGFSIPARAGGFPDLEGLSCRWEPLNSTRGRMASLLIRGNSKDLSACAAIYREALSGIREIMSADPLNGKPARAANMRFRWPPRGLAIEANLTRGGGTRLRRLAKLGLQSLIQWVLERCDLSAGGYNAPVYREELRANTDHQRFDGTLRIILDCSESELRQVTDLLDRMYRAGKVFYGLHVADSALMTCVLLNLTGGRHLHFVDGANGGFALAAKALKAQKIAPVQAQQVLPDEGRRVG
jgi:hypothetical protein